MKLGRLHISVFLGLAALVWWLVLGVQGTRVSSAYWAPFGTGVSFLVVLGAAFEFLLWRWFCLHGWFVKRPDLRGTWRVELQSDWIDPTTNRGVPLVVCYMGVVQTLSTLQMHLMTPESESWFIAESISESPSAVGYQIAGVYTNRPQTHLRGDRSEMHLGACRELAPSKQESTTYEPSLVCKLLILRCRLLIPDRLLVLLCYVESK